MKLENLRLVPAKPATAQGANAVTPAKPGPLAAPQAQARPPAAPNAGKQAVVGEERRRSQRVLLRVPASIHVALRGKSTSFHVTTLSVSDNGALILMPRTLPVETRLVLEHGTTKKRVTCKISRMPREMPEGFHIPLEFDSPEPYFWGIAFPPADWRPPEDF